MKITVRFSASEPNKKPTSLLAAINDAPEKGWAVNFWFPDFGDDLTQKIEKTKILKYA